jgi:benzoyl-CoA reductase/2-hydroxyglutaryl-CoA dehydratase subunit BcrC/BadD/HgdB
MDRKEKIWTLTLCDDDCDNTKKYVEVKAENKMTRIWQPVGLNDNFAVICDNERNFRTKTGALNRI